MIDIQQEQWQEVWKIADSSTPCSTGVETLVKDGKKLYRAFAILPEAMNNRRIESPVYEACDAADPFFDTGYMLRPHERQAVISNAAVVRALMPPSQRSGEDMRSIAEKLGQQATCEYNKWYEDEQERKKARIEDKEALKAARYLVRGLQLLSEQGTSEEKAVIKAFFGGKAKTDR